MKRELLNYFESLKSKTLPTNRSKFCEDGIDIRRLKDSKFAVGYDSVFTYLFDDQIMCLKPKMGEDWTDEEIMEVVSGDYFNAIDVLSVNGYPTNVVYESDYFGNSYPGHGVATHNLRALNNLEIIHGRDLIKSIINRFEPISSSNWFIIKNSKYREDFMSVMTPECFDDLINLFLADKLGAYIDRHGGNYFFYRKKGSTLWEGVVAIDNEKTLASSYDWPQSKAQNNEMMRGCIQTHTPLGSVNTSTHEENIKEINELLQDGIFGQSQIDTLKKISEYPFEDNMKRTCDKYDLSTGRLYNNVARLWEYNRNALSID